MHINITDSQVSGDKVLYARALFRVVTYCKNMLITLSSFKSANSNSYRGLQKTMDK
jgi:hypothetical protein